MAIKVGETTLTCSVSFTVEAGWDFVSEGPVGGPDDHLIQWGESMHGGCSISLNAFLGGGSVTINGDTATTGALKDYNPSLLYLVEASAGGVTADPYTGGDDLMESAVQADKPDPQKFPSSGSITLSVPCDIMYDTDPNFNPGNLETLRFGASKLIDAPFGSGRLCYLEGAGDITLDVNYGHHLHVSADARGFGIQNSPSLTIGAVAGRGGHSKITAHVTPGISTGGTHASATDAYGNQGECIMMGSDIHAECTSNPLNAGGDDGDGIHLDGVVRASGTITATVPLDWSLSGVIWAVDAPYPHDLHIGLQDGGNPGRTILCSGGHFSASGEQRQENAFCSAECYQSTMTDHGPVSDGVLDVGPVVNINTFGPISMTIDPEDLRHYGEASSEAPDNETPRRILFRGMRFTPIDINQTSTLRIAGPFTLDHEDTAHFLQKDDAATGAHGLQWEGVSLCHGAYLSVQNVSCDGAFDATFTIGTKSWNKDKDGNTLHVDSTPRTFRLDLCNPTNQTADNDAQYTRWTLNGTNSDNIDEDGISHPVFSVNDGPYWGVSNAINFEVAGIPTGKTFSCGGLMMAQENVPTLNFLPALNDFTQRNANAEDGDPAYNSVYVRSFLQGITDGRISLEQHDISYTIPPSGQIAYGGQSIRGLGAFINGDYPVNGGNHSGENVYPTDGWHAEIKTDDDSFLGAGGAATYLMGGGAYCDGSTWLSGAGVAPGPIPAQELFDTMRFDTGLSTDVFKFGGNGVTLRAAAILSGSAAGLTLSTDATRSTSLPVRIDHGAKGSGTSNSGGYFKCTGPGVPGGGSADIEAVTNATPYPHAIPDFPIRMLRRVVLRGNPTCCDSLFCSGPYQFPFTPQFSDPMLLPLEPWRSFPGAASSPSITETSTTETDVTSSGGQE